MSKVVDARGLSCPEPVILVRKALDEARFPIVVLVDAPAARENVRRLAEKAGCHVVLEDTGEETRLTFSR